ncbi:MAG: type III-B CRISPR-associated protein Cas10/Cmr2, partial [Kiritimatiellae bacterium]|nr:type III-B CRISPR-associated protein Cas10/Cmr2 [Kiritimatiellia bacterium]MDW8458250.1 type III-B CRISPR-associated protein Cas10/Cmr2 [Verrucomicrobiota bacterium]
MNFWQRKLLAFLHDPPHKALDIQGHEEQAKEFIRRAGFDPEEALQEFQRYADYWAAAADRYPLFDSSLRSEFGGEERPFLHPMGGSELPLKQFPNAALLAEWLQVTQPVWDRMLDNISEEDRDRVRFFLHWRRWPVEVCRDPENKMEHRWRSAYQVADTRMPDHPIWLHNSITSALQGCDGKPAFLIFQLGPVQEFIAQARSTRDLWSGSYLLSWLMAHAIKAVTDVCGPDAVIYPFLRAQPLFDLLHRDEIYDKIPLKDVTHQTIWDRLKLHENEILVPNLPNKFLAVVPASNAEHLAEKAEKAARNELENIANVCWDWLDRRHPLKSNWKERFFGQVRSFLQITWQTLAWNQSPPPEYIKKIFGCDVSKFKLTPNPGHWWSYYYQELDRLHAGRRNTRDFQPWMLDDDKKQGASKDMLSGKEEIVFDMDWWINKPDDERFLSLFRTEDRLGAINVIKRVWHEAYLRDVWHLKPEKTLRFQSVPDIAAAEWLNHIRREAVRALAESRQEFDRIYGLCEAMQRHAGEYRVRISKQPLSERNLDTWLRETAPDAFMADSWERKERIPEGKIVTKRCDNVIAELRKLYEDKKFGPPPSYVAIIALDGDSMGKWISGELTPPLLEQFSKEAKDALAAQVEEGTKRTLSPSYHLQFSEALANFALYLVRPIVEYFLGQVIYAGGDDVLAMVPASKGL